MNTCLADLQSQHARLEVRHLRREFEHGNVTAVKDVSLTIQAGQIYALVGPNGAGKTTTVRMCAALLTPTSGSISVNGVDAVRLPAQARASLGLMLGGELGFYPRASAEDNLRFFADLQGVPYRERNSQVLSVLERVNLLDVKDRKVSSFSRGMRQRLHIARALLGNPQLLLLDEPTTGLDPDVALQVRDLIRDVASTGCGILLTSHAMAEVEELADAIAVIMHGEIITRGTVSDIARTAGVSHVTSCLLSARYGDAVALLKQRLAGLAQVQSRAQAGQWAVSVYWHDAAPQSAVSHTQITAQKAHHTSPEDRTHTVACIFEELGVPSAALDNCYTRRATLEEAYLDLVEREQSA